MWQAQVLKLPLDDSIFWFDFSPFSTRPVSTLFSFTAPETGDATDEQYTAFKPDVRLMLLIVPEPVFVRVVKVLGKVDP